MKKIRKTVRKNHISQTPIHNTHQTFRMNEDFFRQVIESIEDYAVFTTDKNGLITSWNSGAQRLLGYEETEIIGRDARILFIPEDIKKKAPEKELQTAIQNGRALDERLHVRKDTTQFWTSGLVFPLKDEQGVIQGFTKIMRDLSVKRQREQQISLQSAALAASEERYRAFIKHSSEGIWRFEVDQPISIKLPIKKQIEQMFQYAYLAEANNAMAQMYGFESSSSIIGARLHEFLVPTEKKNTNYLTAFIKSGYNLTDALSYEIDREGKNKIFQNNLVGIVENGFLKRAWGTQRDITESRLSTKRQKILETISGKLVTSLNYQLTLNQIATLMVQDFADYCRIAILDENNTIHEIAVDHTDPKKVTLAKDLYDTYKNMPKVTYGIPHILATGKSEIIPVITDDVLRLFKTEKKLMRIIKKIGLQSYMGVPLIARGKVIGAITLSSVKETVHYSPEDLRLAEEIAHRIALTLDNIRLFQELEKDLAARTALAIDNAKLYEKVAQEQMKLKALYDANIIGVHICDFDGNIKEANDAFLKLVGRTRQELEAGNINLFKMTTPEYQKVDRKAFRLLKAGKFPPPWEKVYMKPDGSEVPALVGRTVIDFKSKEIISFLLDITERKRLEQRKDEFISIASHELKTPLTSIKGYIQILERIIEELGNDKAKTIVSRTNIYINRLNSLITDLLDVSKIQAGKLEFNKETFDFYELVHESIENIQTTNTKHTVICHDCPHIMVHGDKHRLEQVLMNLLSNAIKYSPKTNKVLITISDDKKNLKVAVKDYGIGIPIKNQNKIFQRFYRGQKTAKQFSGLGIGLYISAEIVTRHGGRIWVESRDGIGSTFYFTLPLPS